MKYRNRQGGGTHTRSKTALSSSDAARCRGVHPRESFASGAPWSSRSAKTSRDPARTATAAMHAPVCASEASATVAPASMSAATYAALPARTETTSRVSPDALSAAERSSRLRLSRRVRSAVRSCSAVSSMRSARAVTASSFVERLPMPGASSGSLLCLPTEETNGYVQLGL